VVGVEALAVSHELAVRNAFLNGLENRYEPKLGDLRDPQVLSGELPFDLISGAPPFKQIGTGTLPKCAQRAASRFEFRGGVEEYARTASMHLAPHGKVVILMDGLASSRVRAERSLLSVGLFPCNVLAIRPRPERAPVYWIIEAGRKPSDIMDRTVSMRPAVGASWSQEYAAVRLEMDLP
jgi:tRNA1(Val) A37 N6-methylase TrmN6